MELPPSTHDPDKVPLRHQNLNKIRFSLVLLVLILLNSVVFFTKDRNDVVPQQIQTSTVGTPIASPDNTSPVPQPTIPADLPIPILMYHYIRDHKDTADRMGVGLSVSPNVFQKQLDTLAEAGYTTITFTDLAKPLPAKPIIITFDDGYADAYTTVLPILKQKQMKGVFYIVSDFVNKDRYITSEHVKELDAAGMEIGSHTVNHKDLSKMSESDQRVQLTESKARLESLLGKAVTAFCYPSGKYNEITTRIAREVGYASATTVVPGIASGYDLQQNQFELKRVRIKNDTDLLRELK